ncbi:hypothetical protein DEU56DRAFT_750205 [Suillus clintonianus]|uniref:uncharacterized protein n=1 Tax=Suillus clintonianus TaxID=1904413 RepID=UPI001B868B3C|nr:uncharacterized protein DEU56DRAFT_750205 [Suillus clintonianus]KAG2156983.1 hypothetical protein DEU56DRAFT_750205 [Suillus clintonianus]
MDSDKENLGKHRFIHTAVNLLDADLIFSLHSLSLEDGEKPVRGLSPVKKKPLIRRIALSKYGYNVNQSSPLPVDPEDPQTPVPPYRQTPPPVKVSQNYLHRLIADHWDAEVKSILWFTGIGAGLYDPLGGAGAFYPEAQLYPEYPSLFQWGAHLLIRSGKVNITEQQPHIQDMLWASITCLHKHILFENTYLDLQQRRKIMANILLSCAKDGEEFVDPKDHIGTIHASYYGPTKGADDRVVNLLKNNAYIYPVNIKRDPNQTKLFQVPAILDTIEDAFFSDELAVEVKWHDHLTLTIDDYSDEVELPIVMVALASTASHN